MPRHIPLDHAVVRAVVCLAGAASGRRGNTQPRAWAPLQIVRGQAGLSPAMSRTPGVPAPLQRAIARKREQ